MRPTRRSALAAAGAAALASSLLVGCGQDAVTAARAEADASLRRSLGTAIACVRDHAADLVAAQAGGRLAEALTPCAGTTFLDQSDDAILASSRPLFRDHTMAISSELSGTDLVLSFYTDGAGLAEAGVSRDRALIAACWEVAVTGETGDVGEPTSTPCKASVVTRLNPSDQVPVEDFD